MLKDIAAKRFSVSIITFDGKKQVKINIRLSLVTESSKMVIYQSSIWESIMNKAIQECHKTK